MDPLPCRTTHGRAARKPGQGRDVYDRGAGPGCGGGRGATRAPDGGIARRGRKRRAILTGTLHTWWQRGIPPLPPINFTLLSCRVTSTSLSPVRYHRDFAPCSRRGGEISV